MVCGPDEHVEGVIGWWAGRTAHRGFPLCAGQTGWRALIRRCASGTILAWYP
jgi:hypothetical protein